MPEPDKEAVNNLAERRKHLALEGPKKRSMRALHDLICLGVDLAFSHCETLYGYHWKFGEQPIARESWRRPAKAVVTPQQKFLERQGYLCCDSPPFLQLDNDRRHDSAVVKLGNVNGVTQARELNM